MSWQFSRRMVFCGALVAGLLPARGLADSAAEDKLLAVLRSSAPAAEKEQACFALKRAGTVRSVPALAELLTDGRLSYAARDALTSMPFPEAGAALRDALPRARGTIRIGLIASLGVRRDAAAVSVLIPLLSDPNAEEAAAAAAALGEIASPKVAQALAEALTRADGKRRAVLGDGCLRCAQRLARAGERAEAVALFRQLAASEQDRNLRRAAHLGLLQLAGDRKLPMMLELLSGNDPDARAVAAGQIDKLIEGEFRSLAANVGKLSPANQEAVFAALVLREDRSLLPLVIEAARSGGSARPAALVALGRLGDASALPVLVEALYAGPATHEAARRGLELLRGRDVDHQLIALMQKEQAPERRGELIEVLGSRGTVSVVPILLDQAGGENAAVRTRAMSALARLAQPKDVPSLMHCFYRSAPGPERDNAEKAILAVCESLAPEQRADPLLAVLAKANDSEKAAALPLLGRTGVPAAMREIKTALASKNAELYGGGVRALASWPRPEVAGQLLGLAQETTNPDHRSLAVTGLARVVTSPGKMPPGQRLEFLKKAMALAETDADRRAVLERAGAVHTVESLRFTLPYLDQPALSEQACRTVVTLAHQRKLRLPNQKEFNPALERVIRQSQEAGTVDRARKYLAGL
jgi:HEAT repeat protein